ncbi:hypothetical protein ERJ75_000138200 [Trypanosoma vivax]|uniref:Uncharacterized protein n=1 Tax=Trypanosoma vivax (strain Y486) TaxID=1055687 RepID=G0TW79_TRYVY|nr:hypothetical protein TRVL_02729 [Trypanosoma vivax]KAH8619732.1 hypothetical protein ERJ75_000138200 [Trypanosoma vivax]CCC48217.1 conserved hypothetical protein [Trypanosoma vivax Y486]
MAGALKKMEDAVLEAVICELMRDHSARVSACLPRILANVVDYGLSSAASTEHKGKQTVDVQFQATHGAISVAECLERAINSEAKGDNTWTTAEVEWNAFLEEIGGRWLQDMGLKGLVTPIVEALSPLITFLASSGDWRSKKHEIARDFYARAVSSLLRHIVSAHSTEMDVFVRRGEWKSEFGEILLPFMKSEVEPLEKELAFHFRAGRRTARSDEPQHCLSFLLQIFNRYSENTRARWWAFDNAGALWDAEALVSLGAVALASTAISIFYNVYEWHDRSGNLRRRDFVVHGVNSILDFLSRARGVVHENALILMAENLLFPQAFYQYLDAVRVMAEETFRTGTRLLWRLQFLEDQLAPALPKKVLELARGAQHMLRCIEAVIRRLGIVFSLIPGYNIVVWEQFVNPSVEMFLDSLEAIRKQKEANSNWVTDVDVAISLLHTLQAVHTSTEEWYGRCEEVSKENATSYSTLRRLSQWRDKLTAETTQSAVEFMRVLFGSDQQIYISQLYACNSVIQQLEMSKTSAHIIVLRNLRNFLRQSVTSEQLKQLEDYTRAIGLHHVADFMGEIKGAGTAK